MRVVGLMSGTSADGIEAVLCEISGAPPALTAGVVASISYPFDPDLQRRIHRAARAETSDVEQICLLNAELGELFALASLRLIAQAGLTPADIDLIVSSGQTVWHAVAETGGVLATLQIGESSVIAERTGITTIGNLRARDVAAGGHGAPLVSYVDWLLLRHPAHWRAVQNIGGIGNVTFLPPQSDAQSRPLAFDTGPGNALIDWVTAAVTGGTHTYDEDGFLARQGQADEAWLAELLGHPYYRRTPPKTTGRELFSPAMAESLLAQGRTRGLTDAGIVATVTALTADSIADAYARFAPSPPAEVIVAGGGARNPALMDRLRARLPGARVLALDELGVASQTKEALAFAMIGYETWHHRPGSLPELTGASHPVVLGQITPADNFPRLIQSTFGGQP